MTCMTAVPTNGLTIAVMLLLAACSSAVPPDATYAAEIRRTSYGIAHVKAQDEAGIGYGMGYAYAQDNVCVLAEAIVTVNGERSRYFAPDAVGGPDFESGSIHASNLHSDFFFTFLNSPQRIATAWERQPPEVQARMKGYAAGFNRFVADTGLGNLPAACRDAPWIRPITEHDLVRMMRRLTVEAGSLWLLQGLVDAAPPGSEEKSDTVPLARLETARARANRLGSNGVALGKDATANGRGLLLANPHYPWYGSLRFYQVHATIPGELDVMGATLGGFPVVVIGFNRHLAWTHTVNTSSHLTLYALELARDDPTKYQVDGELEALQRQTVSVAVNDGNGGITTRSHDFWVSRYGPIVELPGLEWSNDKAFALRDANDDNDRTVATWHAINRARSLDELELAITTILGLPWVNTLAADADGNTLYTDVTVVPNVTRAQQESCIAAPYKALVEERGLFVLNSGAACEWNIDPAAPQPGIFAGSDLPVLRRTDFVQNSNNSAWMTNPAAPMTGFAPIVSAENSLLWDRTRIGISQIQARLFGADGLAGNRFDAETLQAIAFSNRSYLGSLLREDLLAVCEDTAPVELDGQQVDVEKACTDFRGWDGHGNLESTGYPLATAWLLNLEMLEGIWRVPFSPEDPINTPRGIDLDNPAAVERVREELARGVLALREAGIDASRPWGEIQGVERNGRRIPIHGGRDVYNAVVAEESDGLANVTFGTSYVQVVEFDDDGPNATGFLTYSQSTDSASPHFADQAPRFSALDWIVQPFTDAQIESDPHYTTTTIAE